MHLFKIRKCHWFRAQAHTNSLFDFFMSYILLWLSQPQLILKQMTNSEPDFASIWSRETVWNYMMSPACTVSLQKSSLYFLGHLPSSHNESLQESRLMLIHYGWCVTALRLSSCILLWLHPRLLPGWDPWSSKVWMDEGFCRVPDLPPTCCFCNFGSC